MNAGGGNAPVRQSGGDRDRLRGFFISAGFSDPTIEEVDFVAHADDFDDYWDLLSRAAGAIAMVLDRLESDEREKVCAGIAEAIGPFNKGGTLEMPAQSVVISAS